MLCDVETQQLKPGDAGFEPRMAEYVAFDEMVKKLGCGVTAASCNRQRVPPLRLARAMALG